ncbi:hypothetical protein ACFQ2T_04860 [Methylophilus flavus]|uniref:Phage tail protein n=1 Tax=Methylophilus flavus TaxID=640084 RepID=A0ABW3P9W7_9PROT
MQTKYFVNEQGKYIGSSSDPVPPVTGIEVPSYPSNLTDEVWNGTQWVFIKNITVSRAQAKIALLNAGKLALVQPAIDAISDPVLRQRMQIEWDERLEFNSQNQTLRTLAQVIGINDQELIELLEIASEL